MNVNITNNVNSAGSCAILCRTLFDFCINVFGKVILNVIFCVYSTCWTLKASVNINSLVFNVLRTYVKTETEVNDETFLKNEVLLLKKIPQHLTLIIGDESPSYTDLVKIIRWSISSGISHISFYDHHNGIDRDILFENVCRNAKETIPVIKWGKSFTEEIKTKSKNHINGYIWRPLITIHIYRNEDWPEAVLNCINYIKENGCDDISVKLVNSILKKHFLAPDPDLAIVVGNVLSFFGFPCWHLRITQIQKIPSHHNISLNTFLKNLTEYNGCEQRYGK